MAKDNEKEKAILKIQEKIAKDQSDILGLLNKFSSDSKKGDMSAEDKKEEKAASKKHTTLLEQMASGITELNKSFLKSLKTTVGGGLGILVAGIAAPVIAMVAFFKQLALEFAFLKKLTGGGLRKIFAPLKNFLAGKGGVFTKIGNFFKSLFKIKVPVFGPKTPGMITRTLLKISKFFKSIGNFVKNFKAIPFSGIGPSKPGLIVRVITKIGKFFKTILGLGKSLVGMSKTATMIVKWAGTFGRVLGKIFLPITILMSAFDFITGFMDGYKEDGIMGGLEGGLSKLFKGLIGMPLDLLKDVVGWAMGLMGFDKAKELLADFSFSELIEDMISGYFDMVKGVVNWVKNLFKDPVGTLTKLWDDMLEGAKSIGSWISKTALEPLTKFFVDMFTWSDKEVTETFSILDTVEKALSAIGKYFSGLFDIDWKSAINNIVPDFVKNAPIIGKYFGGGDDKPANDSSAFPEESGRKTAEDMQKKEKGGLVAGFKNMFGFGGSTAVEKGDVKGIESELEAIDAERSTITGTDQVSQQRDLELGKKAQKLREQKVKRMDELEQIKKDEGFEAGVYKDTMGIKTIGYGFNLERAGSQEALDAANITSSLEDLKSGKMKLTKEEASRLMMGEMGHFRKVAENYVGKETWGKLGQNRQGILTNMAYNMGEGTLNKFKNLKAAIIDGDWKQAQAEMKDSNWAKQVKGRSDRLIARMGQNDSGSQLGSAHQESVRLASNENNGPPVVISKGGDNTNNSTSTYSQPRQVRNDKSFFTRMFT